MEIKLKKEEEERIKRRERVSAIMRRTRAKENKEKSGNASTKVCVFLMSYSNVMKSVNVFNSFIF